MSDHQQTEFWLKTHRSATWSTPTAGQSMVRRRPLCRFSVIFPYSGAEDTAKSSKTTTAVQNFEHFSVQRSEEVDFWIKNCRSLKNVL